MKQELEITITPEGETVIEVKGVKGNDCLKLTKSIEEELGSVKERKLKSDYYQKQRTKVAQQLKH